MTVNGGVDELENALLAADDGVPHECMRTAQAARGPRDDFRTRCPRS